MKGSFSGFYRPTKGEFATLWSSAIIFVDANVLLNMYAYSETTREKLLSLLEALKERLRMPHQFALEYQRNRAKAIMEQVKNCADVEKQLRTLYEQQFEPKLKHPFLSNEMLADFNKIREALCTSRKALEGLFASDPYHDRITTLFDGKIGKAPTSEELQKLHEVAKERFDAQVPPGYADVKDKGEPDAYGDYIGWSQVLSLAKEAASPTILVTDDSKNDWWQIQSERTIGPRPELVAEFKAVVGQQFYMYSSPQFMKWAGDTLDRRVEEGVIQEVRSKLEEQQRSVSEMKASPPDRVSDAKGTTPISEEAPSPSKPDVPREDPKASATDFK
jgi:hypothetical protein